MPDQTTALPQKTESEISFRLWKERFIDGIAQHTRNRLAGQEDAPHHKDRFMTRPDQAFLGGVAAQIIADQVEKKAQNGFIARDVVMEYLEVSKPILDALQEAGFFRANNTLTDQRAFEHSVRTSAQEAFNTQLATSREGAGFSR